ncbi:hypothetical protein ACP4OV_015810 [Aristida adscensionis]
MDGAAEAAAAAAVPFLVHDVGDKYDFDPHTQYSIASRQLAHATMELLLDHDCLETPQGWVLALHRASAYTFLWRPQDGHRIALPPMDTADLPTPGACSPTSSPMSPAPPTSVLGAKWQHRSYTLATLNSEGWPMLAEDVGIAAVGGKIYHQLSGHELGVLEFDPVHAEPTLKRIQVEKVCPPPGSPVSSSYLVESCDELFLWCYVAPMSAISSITLTNKSSVVNDFELAEKLVGVGMDDADQVHAGRRAAATLQLIAACVGVPLLVQSSDCGVNFINVHINLFEATPMSAISSITLINKFRVGKDAELAEKLVTVGMDEGLALLKAALRFRCVHGELARKK